ncbi:acetate/propionate family kinase [Candidatus Omnitrophota bacterium]
MKILVLNSGSSSVKYQLFEMNDSYSVLAKGLIERISLKNSKITHIVNETKKAEIAEDIPNHNTAIKKLLEHILVDPGTGVINDLSEIDGVGHRVVHGGEKFCQSVLINDDVIYTIKDCCDLAPLHNPPNLLGIEACKEVLPSTPQIAVFDTAFHQTMPKKAFVYGLPYEQYLKYGVRRYGFHGTSHQYVSTEALKLLNKENGNSKIITCHLGNGCSLTAVHNGKSIDTSMGMTPMEGVLMGTRCGDIDPCIILYMMEKENLTIDDIITILNKKSGLFGLSGKSDMRDVLLAMEKKDELAKNAIDVFVYKIVKYIGAYAAAMNGVDAIVFTAGIGEKNSYLRGRILANLTYLGIIVDEESNKAHAETISSAKSAVKIFVIPTNEELVIAQDTYKLIKNNS